MNEATKSALLSRAEEAYNHDVEWSESVDDCDTVPIIRELLAIVEAQDKALSCEWPCKTLVKDAPSVKVYCSSCKTRADTAERLGRLCDK